MWRGCLGLRRFLSTFFVARDKKKGNAAPIRTSPTPPRCRWVSSPVERKDPNVLGLLGRAACFCVGLFHDALPLLCRTEYGIDLLLVFVEQLKQLSSWKIRQREGYTHSSCFVFPHPFFSCLLMRQPSPSGPHVEVGLIFFFFNLLCFSSPFFSDNPRSVGVF